MSDICLRSGEGEPLTMVLVKCEDSSDAALLIALRHGRQIKPGVAVHASFLS